MLLRTWKDSMLPVVVEVTDAVGTNAVERIFRRIQTNTQIIKLRSISSSGGTLRHISEVKYQREPRRACGSLAPLPVGWDFRSPSKIPAARAKTEALQRYTGMRPSQVHSIIGSV